MSLLATDPHEIRAAAAILRGEAADLDALAARTQTITTIPSNTGLAADRFRDEMWASRERAIRLGRRLEQMAAQLQQLASAAEAAQEEERLRREALGS
jgi:uncharacterized protein YukE